MKILIVYATYSGSTKIVAEIIKKVLEDHHHKVTIFNVFDFAPKEFNIFDLIILGSNSWFELKQEGQMNSGFHQLSEHLQPDTFKNKKCIVFSTGDSHQYNNTYCKSAEYLEKLIKDHQGNVVGPSLCVDRFYFDQENQEKRVREWAASVAAGIVDETPHNLTEANDQS